jgi:hypothetical protein
MGLLRSTNGYDRMSDAKLLEMANFIHQQVSTRTNVFATPTPTMPVLRGAIDDYQIAINAALNRDKVLIAQKKAIRQTVIDLLHQLGSYVIMVANGDRVIALEAGIPLAKEPSSVIITPPEGTIVSYGNQPGELKVKVKTIRGAASYMHQYTADPTLKEESWTTVNSTTAKTTINGLTPGTTYFFRVGVVGYKEQVLYGDVVSKMAA